MSQTETAEVAAELTKSILGEVMENMAGDPAAENAARMLTEMGQPVEAPQVPVVSSPTPAVNTAPEVTPPNEPVVEEPEVEPDSLPDFSPQIDDDYQALLDERDFDEEARAEVAAEQADSYDDSFDADTAAQLRAKDKKIAWLEEQNVKANRSKWIAEAEKSFPLLKTYAPDEIREITATSRRGFAREAQKLHERYAKVLAPAIADLNAAKAAARTDAEKTARASAKEAWGLPVAEPAGSAVPSTEQQRALDKAREDRAPLEERIKILGGILPVQ